MTKKDGKENDTGGDDDDKDDILTFVSHQHHHHLYVQDKTEEGATRGSEQNHCLPAQGVHQGKSSSCDPKKNYERWLS